MCFGINSRGLNKDICDFIISLMHHLFSYLHFHSAAFMQPSIWCALFDMRFSAISTKFKNCKTFQVYEAEADIGN